MRTPLLISLLVVPTVGFAQKACYSPSDCVTPLHCTSLDDGKVPGTCITTVANQATSATPKPIVKKTLASSATATASAASSETISSSVSSSASSAPTLPEGFGASLLSSLNNMMSSISSMFSSMMNSFKCMFGSC